MLADPQQLGKGEAGQRRVCREFNQLRGTDLLGDLFALLLRALIAPDDRRPQHFAAVIQQNGAMHLPREANASNGVRGYSSSGESRTECVTSCAPPVARILLRPIDFSRSEMLVIRWYGA